MENPRCLLVGLGLMLSLTARPSSACSIVPEPTNFGLVAESENIAIGRVVSTLEVTLKGYRLMFEIEITHLLRGAGLTVGQRVRIGSRSLLHLNDYVRGPLHDSAGNGHRISELGQLVWIGKCQSSGYTIGMHYLVFLNARHLEFLNARPVADSRFQRRIEAVLPTFDAVVPIIGAMPVITQPKSRGNASGLSRLSQEFEPEGDLWTTAVITYIKIADLPTEEERKKAFDELIARSSRANASPTDRAIAIDVKNHLLEKYKTSLENMSKPEDRSEAIDALLARDARSNAGETDRYIASILRNTGSPYMRFADLKRLLAAPGADRDEIIKNIGRSGDPAARAFLRDMVKNLSAGTLQVSEEAIAEAIRSCYWGVTDSPGLTEIAELALSARGRVRASLVEILIRRAGSAQSALMERLLISAYDGEAIDLGTWFERHPSDAARRDMACRLGNDFVTRWSLTLPLGGMGDPGVFAWAKAQLRPGIEGGPRSIALNAIARSPLPEADALVSAIILVSTIFYAGGADLEALIQGYADARHTRADLRLAEIGKITSLPANTRRLLEITILQRKNAD